MSSPNQVISEKFNAADADIIFRAASDDLVEAPSTLFRFHKSKLGSSEIMKSMLEVGHDGGSQEPPIVDLTERSKVVEMLLSYMTNEAGLFPNLKTAPNADVLDLFKATLKLEIPLVMVIVENDLIQKSTHMSLADAFKLYNTAKLAVRDELLAACSARIVLQSPQHWGPYMSLLNSQDVLDLTIQCIENMGGWSGGGHVSKNGQHHAGGGYGGGSSYDGGWGNDGRRGTVSGTYKVIYGCCCGRDGGDHGGEKYGQW